MARITRMLKLRLGELLQASGLVTEEQVRLGLEEQRKSNLLLGEALVKLGFITEDAVAQTLVHQFNLPFVSANQFSIQAEVFNLFPETMYFEYQFIAVDKLTNVLLIVTAGLMNHDVIDELERLSGCKICQYIGTWNDIRGAIQKNSKSSESKANLTSLGAMLLEADAPAKSAGVNAAVGGASAPGKPATAFPALPKENGKAVEPNTVATSKTR